MVCGQGGSLLCCDACPAAYHSKCMGLNPRELPPKWQCPECAAGGRGEAAGLRAPVVGVDDGAGGVVWAAYGRLFVSHPRGPLERGEGAAAAAATAAPPSPPPAARGKGKQQRGKGAKGGRRGSERPAVATYPILPDAPECGLVMLTGKAAAAKLDQVRRAAAALPPHPSAFDAVVAAAAAPPAVGDAEHYVNRYRNAWPTAAAALKAWIEDQSKRKRAGLSGLPAPMPVIEFSWQEGGMMAAGAPAAAPGEGVAEEKEAEPAAAKKAAPVSAEVGGVSGSCVCS
jgi:hypothetical protein